MPLPRSKVGDADFVNDYVAKKQAQMQRAREIREERNKRTEEKQRQQQEQQQHQEELATKETLMEEQQENENQVQGEAEEELTHNSSSQHKSKKTKMPLKRSAAGHRERCILQVVEEDFTKATQAGIITPDQARQLWAMFSDQVIRVVPGEPHVNSTVSIESLLTLSNHTSASATTPSSSLCNSVDAFNSVNYNNTNHSNHSSSGSNTNNTSTGFGGSISLESLRQSIANFKKEQKRKGKNNMSKVHATNKPTQYNNFDKSNNDNNNDDESEESDENSNAHVKQTENQYKNEESGGDDGADDHAAYFNTGSYLRTLNKGNEQSNITKRSASSSTNNTKKTRKKFMRPEWNFDVGVADAQSQEQEQELQHEHDNKAMGHAPGNAGVYPNNSSNVKQKQEKSNNNDNIGNRNIKKTSQATNSDNNNNIVTGAQKGKLTALDRKKDNVTTKFTTQYNLQEDNASSASITPTNINNNNNKARSHASNNASRFSSSKSSSGMVNLDDIPVGKAAHDANNNVFANWDNAFPVTNQSDVKYNFLTTSSSALTGNGNTKGLPNELIEHEASAAAQEPLRECGTCGRSFRVSVLPRHEAVCRKQANKKRIAFDMQSQRLDGVEGMNEVRKTTDAFSKNWAKKMNNNNNSSNNNNNINKTNAQKMPKWKIEHEQFQAAMRAAHMQSALETGNNNNNMNNINMFGKGNPSVLPPPPPPLPPELDNRVLCPHCGRKFAEETAARHIPKCATTIAKPKGIRPIRR